MEPESAEPPTTPNAGDARSARMSMRAAAREAMACWTVTAEDAQVWWPDGGEAEDGPSPSPVIGATERA